MKHSGLAWPSPSGCCAILLAGLSLIACATTGPVPVASSRAVIRNAAKDSCDLAVNHNYLMRIEPHAALLVSNLPVDSYELSARCGEANYAAQLDPGAGPDNTMVEFAIPGDDSALVDKTGALLVKNPTRIDVEIRCENILIGRIFAGSESFFTDIRTGELSLVARENHTGGEWQVQVTVSPLEVTQITLTVPYAGISFLNDSQEKVRAFVLDRHLTVDAGAQVLLESLPPGRLMVTVRFVATGRTMVIPVFLTPGAEEQVKLSSRSGQLTVENKLSEEATLSVDKTVLTTVAAGQQQVVRGLAPGPLTLHAETASGQHYHQPFMIIPDTTQVWALEAENSQIMLRNDIGEKATLLVDGRTVMEVPDRGAVRFAATPGHHELALRCESTGHTDRKSVDVPGSRLVEVAFGPQGGRLYLANLTGETLRFFRNGKSLSMLDPGETAEHSGQPLGNSLVEVLDPRGKTLLKKTVALRAGKDNRTELVVSSVETLVYVTNFTGEDVKVGPEARTDQRVIPSGESSELFMKGTQGVIKFKGETTSNRYDRTIAGPFEGRAEIVLEPVTGGLAIFNDSSAPLTLLLDDDDIGQLAPGAELRKDRVAPGKHHLTAMRDGKPFATVSCRLVADSWYVWKLADKTGAVKILNRAGEALKIFHGSEPAGTLSKGTEVLFDGLPPGAVSFAAVGSVSGQVHRISFTARHEETIQWRIESATGGLRLFGFDQRAAAVYINGLPVLEVPSGATEPISIPLQTGAHSLKVRFANGDVMGTLVQATTNLETTVHVGDNAPSVEVRNQTGETLTLRLNGFRLNELAAGEVFIVTMEHPGRHQLIAESSDGKTQFALQDVMFRAGSRFGWTLTE